MLLASVCIVAGEALLAGDMVMSVYAPLLLVCMVIYYGCTCVALQ